MKSSPQITPPKNNFPKLHNAMWPGLVGKGSPGAEPAIDLDTMLEYTAKAEVDGQKFEGPLMRIDDFLITIALADGSSKTFRRTGSTPAIQITDPLAGHKQLWLKLTDDDIHNVTAYLVTLK